LPDAIKKISFLVNDYRHLLKKAVKRNNLEEIKLLSVTIKWDRIGYHGKPGCCGYKKHFNIFEL